MPLSKSKKTSGISYTNVILKRTRPNLNVFDQKLPNITKKWITNNKESFHRNVFRDIIAFVIVTA